jgi:hypothetical protein
MCTSNDLEDLAHQWGENSAVVLQQFIQSPKQSVRWCARETGISRTSLHRILKTAKWKCYVLRLLHAMVEDYPHHRAESCQWFQRKVDEDAQFVDLTVWSDEATFELSGTVNRQSHVLVFWKSEHSCWQGSEFTRTYSLVWCVIQGYCGTMLWRDSYWCQVYQHAWGIHCASHLSAV